MIDLRGYLNRDALAYFALSLPALLLQIFFILAIVKAPTISLSGTSVYTTIAFHYLPWAIPVFSVYAIATLRSSLHLSLLILSYFVASIISGGAALAVGRYLLSPGETAVFVVATCFCCLVAFRFSRAARIQRNRPEITSSGPLPQQTIAVLLEFLFPAAIAVILVLSTVLVIGALKDETAAFPTPLSTIFSDFVVSPVITVVIAALTLVVVKNLVEPFILYYTITREDAVKIFQKEAKEMQARRGLVARIASGGILFSIIATFILLSVILILFGSHTVLANVGPALRIGKPTSEPSFLIRVDNAYIEFEKLLDTIVHLLWG